MTIEILGGKLSINGFVFKHYSNEAAACHARDVLVDLLEENNYTFAEAKNSSDASTLYCCTLSISCKKSSSPPLQPATV